MPLIDRRDWKAGKVEDRRRDVHEADHPVRTMLIRFPFRRCDQERHTDVFLIEIERVAVIAFVLTERFAVIAKDDPDGLRREPALLHALHQRAEGRVSFAQRVAIAAELVVLVEWSGLR